MDRYRMPTTRPLRVYAFDPSAGRRLNNYMTVPVPYEKLEPGPVGRLLAVIDYDVTDEVFFEAVNLDHPAVLMGNGLDPSESDPRFHQQMVYAVAAETMSRFEFALGRPIHWRRDYTRRTGPLHAKLRLFPHAFLGANAFYDAGLRAVLFGYFPAKAQNAGDLLPGQIVFTCLSHDIIAHEMTHAIIDGQCENLLDATGPDAAAFHEAFADIVALFQHFTYQDALLDTINRTGGLIYRTQLDKEVPASTHPAIIPELTEDNPLVELARDFGQATSGQGALRSAIGTPPNSQDILTITEPHQRGSILVSAVFDAFFTVYIKRTRDLMRIARAGGAVSPAGDLHPDLARRLAKEAASTAATILNICIRALDYLPPVDVTFGEFLRAIITADSDLVPDDPLDYRGELIKAFRLRGIIPKSVKSFSADALRWQGPELRDGSMEACTDLDYGMPRSNDPAEEEAHDRRQAANAIRLNKYAQKYAAQLGLASDPDREPDPNLKLDPNQKPQAYSHHPIQRISPTGRLVTEFVARFLRHSKVALDPSLPDSPTFEYRGGATVIFDACGAVRYVIKKSIANPDRLTQQRGFHQQCLQQLNQSAVATYLESRVEQRLNFQLIHSGAWPGDGGRR